jgi:hypothetical protein
VVKLIIAGSRSFDDYDRLCVACNHLTQNFKVPVVVISGCARGADRLGERWADSRRLHVERFPADWDRHGKAAGYRRNEAMARAATHCIVFWDGQSPGAKHMIDLARQYRLQLRIVRFK